MSLHFASYWADREIKNKSTITNSKLIRNYVAEIATHHVTKHNTPIHNILSTAPQLNISQKALGTLPEGGNVMPKHVGATIRN
jgi:hypothetical protein